jgi:hypothetical protein
MTWLIMHTIDMISLRGMSDRLSWGDRLLYLTLSYLTLS